MSILAKLFAWRTICVGTPQIVIAKSELEADESARFWAFALHLAEHRKLRKQKKYQPFWLAHQYDVQVSNGGHLQYFHNCGTEGVAATLSVLTQIGARTQAAALAECWDLVKSTPVHKVSSLEEYSSLAEELSFDEQDDMYFGAAPPIQTLLEVYFESLIRESVAVDR